MAERLSHRKPAPPPLRVEWAFFFDIDGTLADLAPSPSEVVFHEELPDMIATLQALTDGAVALLTGRAIADVDNMLSLNEIAVAGQHGFEVRIADGEVLSSSIPDGNIEAIRHELEKATARHQGLITEFKGTSIALHYRAAPRLAPYAHRLMRSLAKRHAPGFVVQKGKRVVELRPAAFDKGVALERLMHAAPFAGRVPVFAGDDLTDESGFAVINRMSGHSIKVGPGRTAARWRLRDVTAVRRWLQSGIDAEIAAPSARR